MEKLYRVQMNSNGMPNFSTAVEIDTDISEYSDKLWKNAYERGKADRPSAVDLSSVYSTAYKSGYEKGKADRPQGEWIASRNNIGHKRFECSVCGGKQPYRRFDFCPSCGAKMKGADDERG